MWPASFASCSEVCEGLTYFLNAKPLGCFAGLCGCNAWKLNVRLQHSLLVAFHYKPEADHRLSLGDLRQKKKTSQAGLQPLEVAVEQRRKKWNAAMKKNLSPYTLQCMSYSCAEIACGREIVACIMISSPSYSPPVIQSCFPLSLSLSLLFQDTHRDTKIHTPHQSCSKAIFIFQCERKKQCFFINIISQILPSSNFSHGR